MGATSTAAKVRRRITASRDRFWEPADFDGTPSSVAKALSRLEKAGELERIRRGLYWRGTSTLLGMAPPSAMKLSSEMVGRRGVGPAAASAALALGLSTHVPRVETVAIPARVPTNVGSTVRFVSRSASVKRLENCLRASEIALLEVLRDWDRYVDIPDHDALDQIRQLIENDKIRVGPVVEASGTEPARSRERLRELLVSLSFNTEAECVHRARYAWGVAG